MKTIGILFGMEQTFPPALVERINSMGIPDVSAEFVKVGGVKMDELMKYDVILDRISQDIPFYRSMLKNAALNGTVIVNNPFWWSADDKFFNYAIASKIGVPIPKTVLLPSKAHPPDTTGESMRNLMYPLNWEEIFEYVGFPAFLKPHSGGGWKHVYKVNDANELFAAYNKTGDIVMTLQEGIDFEEYYRCYVIGGKHIRIMPYEPRNPHHLRYVAGFTLSEERRAQLEGYCIMISKALGYDFNTIEFAVRNGVPYAIDFLNPAPDAERTSVQEDNFEWVLQTTAKYLIELAQQGRKVPTEYNWSSFIANTAPVAPLEETAIDAAPIIEVPIEVTPEPAAVVNDEASVAVAVKPAKATAKPKKAAAPAASKKVVSAVKEKAAPAAKAAKATAPEAGKKNSKKKSKS